MKTKSSLIMIGALILAAIFIIPAFSLSDTTGTMNITPTGWINTQTGERRLGPTEPQPNPNGLWAPYR